jgi:hypothetical protein
MLVPTLPEARYLILDDADLSSLVCVAMAAERWGSTGGKAPAPVVVPSWWRDNADGAMPLVHRCVERHALVYAHRPIAEELVVEPAEPAGSFPELSALLLAATRLAGRLGCDAVLFPVRAADLDPEGRVLLDTVAREVDRAALVARLGGLDSGAPCSVVTPLIDFDDEQLIDLARELSVPTETCWWPGIPGYLLAAEAAERWGAVRAMPAGPAPSRGLTRTA